MTKRWNPNGYLEVWDELIGQWVPEDTPADPTPREQVIRPAMTPSGDVVNTGVGGNVSQAYVTPRRQYENMFDDIFGGLVGSGKGLPLGPGMGVKRGGGSIPHINVSMFPDISPYPDPDLRRGRY